MKEYIKLWEFLEARLPNYLVSMNTNKDLSIRIVERNGTKKFGVKITYDSTHENAIVYNLLEYDENENAIKASIVHPDYMTTMLNDRFV